MREEIREAIVKGFEKLQNNPGDINLREALTKLIKNKGTKEDVIQLIENNLSQLKQHPGDGKICAIALNLVRTRPYSEEHIKLILDYAQQQMRENLDVLIFQNYITLVQNVIKTGIEADVNVELAKQFGYDFIKIYGWKNPRIVENFANFLYREGFYEEAEQIYKELLKIEANPENMSEMRLSYSQKLLGEAMDLKLTLEERIEKFKKAEKKLREALKFHRGHYMVRTFLAIILKEQGRQDEADYQLKEAERWGQINKKEKFSPGEIPYKIGVFYLKFNRYEEAINWLKIAIEKEPEDYTNWWKLGYAKMNFAFSLEEEGFYKETGNLFTEALSYLETAWKKAKEEETGRALHLPASKKIPAQIDQCRKHLKNKKREGEVGI